MLTTDIKFCTQLALGDTSTLIKNKDIDLAQSMLCMVIKNKPRRILGDVRLDLMLKC